LPHSPSGLTAKKVAERVGAPVSHVGSRLSKLATYEVIKKRDEDESRLTIIETNGSAADGLTA
jgi:formylmethanofuran dehydrogenase subunit E